MNKGILVALFAIYGLGAKAQLTSHFENILSKVDTFWNGVDQSKGFKSGGAFFINDFNSSWGSWTGFALSSMTDTSNGTWANQYSAISGSGATQSEAYAVAYDQAQIQLANSMGMDSVYGVMVNNSTYAYKVVRDGGQFSKKFGGVSSQDPDSFIVIFKGLDTNDITTGEIIFYLADFRSNNSSGDYIVNQWTWVDLKPLGAVSRIEISFNSSDRGTFGMNTPAYVCLDSLVKNSSDSRFAPIAYQDNFQVESNSQQNIVDVAQNDIDPDTTHPVFNLSIVKNARYGTATVNSSGKIEYTPQLGFNNLDSIDYQICDGEGLCTKGLALILVNTGPKVYGELDTVLTGSSLNLDLTLNEVDEDRRTLFYILADSFKTKTFTFSDNGQVTYRASNIIGEDSATYRVCDKFGKCEIAGVKLIVVDELNNLSEYKSSDASAPYPNPTQGELFIHPDFSFDKLITSDGRRIEITTDKNSVDISELPNGTYFLSTKENGKLMFHKIIKTSH